MGGVLIVDGQPVASQGRAALLMPIYGDAAPSALLSLLCLLTSLKDHMDWYFLVDDVSFGHILKFSMVNKLKGLQFKLWVQME